MLVALFAYVDPGSGFILLQLVLAGAIGGVLYFRNLLWKVVRLVTGRRKTGTPEDSTASLP